MDIYIVDAQPGISPEELANASPATPLMVRVEAVPFGFAQPHRETYALCITAAQPKLCTCGLRPRFTITAESNGNPLQGELFLNPPAGRLTSAC